jgi:hypothetical protein
MTQTRRDFFLKYFLADDETKQQRCWCWCIQYCKQFQGKVRVGIEHILQVCGACITVKQRCEIITGHKEKCPFQKVISKSDIIKIYYIMIFSLLP